MHSLSQQAERQKGAVVNEEVIESPLKVGAYQHACVVELALRALIRGILCCKEHDDTSAE